MWLVLADLHLDTKPQHSYRWGIFDWLTRKQQQYKPQGTLILGDLTDEKDCHSSSLVNRIVNGLRKLEPPVYILKGNHDYVRADEPFFNFLRFIDGIRFITDPGEIEGGILAIPHQPNQATFDSACKGLIWNFSDGEPINMVLLHGLFDGAIGDTGTRLSGLSASLVEQMKPKLALAGDVHRPQQVGLINYVGAPYRVRFGDDYIPRVVLVNDNLSLTDLRFPTPMKHSLVITKAEDIPQLNKGDQVKITLDLKPEDAIHWAKHKQRVLDVCLGLGLEVFGIQLRLPAVKRSQPDSVVAAGNTPKDILKGFCQVEDVPENIKAAGLEFLSERQIHPEE